MKNLKIAMIFVAAVAFFCSCGDPVAPTVKLVDANELDAATFNTGDAEFAVDITGTITAENGINTVTLNRTMFDAQGEVFGDVLKYTLENDPTGLNDYSFAIQETITAAEVEGAASIVYDVVVVDQKDAQATASYTIAVVAPEVPEGPQYTEAEFTWMRLGNTREGLDQFGLQWTGNGKAVQAIIKPVEGAKLYIVDAAAFASETVPTLGTPAEQYKSVSCEANGTYNDFIATEYNGKTFIINVTKGVVSSEAAGTKVVITGKYHEFAAATPAAK